MLACALGAFIGALFAIEIQSRFALGSYLWPFGAIFGGIIAWCAADFEQFCFGITRSYRVSANNISRAYGTATGWKPDILFWRAVVTIATGITMCVVTMLSFFGICGVLSKGMWDISFFLLGCFIFSNVIFALMFRSSKKECSESRYKEGVRDIFGLGWNLCKFGNPIILPFVVIIKLWKIMPRFIRFSSSVVRFIAREAVRFFVRVFIYVHSERRTLCFVDATLGAGIGFFFGSAIIGAIAGAVLGAVNYELISVRWLKFVPNKAR